jgi:Zn-dependent protease with chaperone function
MSGLGRYLIIAGIILLLAGAVFMLAGRYIPFGRLPGDIVFRKGDFTFYFPLTSCIVISVVLSLVLFFLSRR